jgi:hypothetical protein
MSKKVFTEDEYFELQELLNLSKLYSQKQDELYDMCLKITEEDEEDSLDSTFDAVYNEYSLDKLLEALGARVDWKANKSDLLLGQ